jgi:hypothetical protein
MRTHPRLSWALLLAAGLSISVAVPAHADAAEDQVRAVLAGMNGSYNSSDFGAFARHLCAQMRGATDFEEGWHTSRQTDGPTRITVNSVDVVGDPPSQAVANVRFQAADHDKTMDVEFEREGSEWKACRYHAGQTV